MTKDATQLKVTASEHEDTHDDHHVDHHELHDEHHDDHHDEIVEPHDDVDRIKKQIKK